MDGDGGEHVCTMNSNVERGSLMNDGGTRDKYGAGKIYTFKGDGGGEDKQRRGGVVGDRLPGIMPRTGGSGLARVQGRLMEI